MDCPADENTTGRPESSRHVKNSNIFYENKSFLGNSFSKNDPNIRKFLKSWVGSGELAVERFEFIYRYIHTAYEHLSCRYLCNE